MRPTFMGFEASKTAIFAAQKALDIVGNNLANISTEGYTRQRVDQVSVSAGNYTSRLALNLVTYAGMGTDINGISQLRDMMLDSAFRSESATMGYYDQRAGMLTDIESIFQELETGATGNGYGLGDAISQLYTSLEQFSSNASSETGAMVVANAVNNIAQLLNQQYMRLDESAGRYKEQLSGDVTEVNGIFKDIAALNKSISNSMVANSYGEDYGPNELLDERNLLLDKLSAFGEISVTENRNGSVSVSFNGHKAVEDTEFQSLSYQENSNGTVSVSWKSDGVNALNGMGILGASAGILNGRGIAVTNANETTERGYLYYKDKLDSFANVLAGVLNNSIPDSYNDDGSVASYKKLVGAEVREGNDYEVYPDMLVTASNIAMTKELRSQSAYLIEDMNSTDNKNILMLISRLSEQPNQFEASGDKFNGTFQEFAADFIGTLGSDASYTSARYDASFSIASEILNSRDSVSAVSESEETSSMLMYNRAFQASSKMMNIMDGLLDVIINQMGI